MAVGKNKKLGKGKGLKKRAVDPFTRKDWYDIKAPTFFENRNVGKTLVNRSQGLSEYCIDFATGRWQACATRVLAGLCATLPWADRTLADHAASALLQRTPMMLLRAASSSLPSPTSTRTTSRHSASSACALTKFKGAPA